MNRFDSEEHGDMGRSRNGSPIFYALLEEMAITHDKKSHDYATNDNPFGNYHFAGKMSLLFSHSEQDAGFIGRIGEKIYRLANLESGEKTPQNESIEDTERDIAVITVLWMADRRHRRAMAWTTGRASEGQILDLDRMTRAMEIDKRNEVAQCQIIEVTEQLSDKGLYDTINYLQAVQERRAKLAKSETRPPNTKNP